MSEYCYRASSLGSQSHPDHVSDHRRSAYCDPPGIGTQVPRLHMSHFIRKSARAVSASIECCVNYPLVDPSPENNSGDCDERLQKKPSVKFIDPVFVRHR